MLQPCHIRFLNEKKLVNLDLSSFNTVNVTAMNNMFLVVIAWRKYICLVKNNDGLIRGLNNKFCEDNYNYDKNKKCFNFNKK